MSLEAALMKFDFKKWEPCLWNDNKKWNGSITKQIALFVNRSAESHEASKCLGGIREAKTITP